jgi:hypothetical protein
MLVASARLQDASSGLVRCPCGRHMQLFPIACARLCVQGVSSQLGMFSERVLDKEFWTGHGGCHLVSAFEWGVGCEAFSGCPYSADNHPVNLWPPSVQTRSWQMLARQIQEQFVTRQCCPPRRRLVLEVPFQLRCPCAYTALPPQKLHIAHAIVSCMGGSQ